MTNLKEIFRANDIRGKLGADGINETSARQIGLGFGTFLRHKQQTTPSVVIGRDCRDSSEVLKDAFIIGLLQTGCNVIDIGLVPTPVMYFGSYHLDTTAGVVVTASHNPIEDNGFKLVHNHEPVSGNKLQEILRIIEANTFASGKGDVMIRDISLVYIAELLSKVQLKRKMKVAVYAGYGMASDIAPKLLRSMGCEVEEVECEIKKNFGCETVPDPSKTDRLKKIIEIMKNNKDIEIGLAFDGDSDRLGVVSRKEQNSEDIDVIAADKLLAFFARDLLKRFPGHPIIIEVKFSKAILDDIETNGGIPKMVKVGYPSIRDGMAKHKSKLGGELSGHFFFGENFYGHDDALYAGCLLIDVLSRNNKSLSQELSNLKNYVTSEELRKECKGDTEKEKLQSIIKDEFLKLEDITEKNEIDGLRITYKNDSWILIRTSTNEPVVSIRFEAKNKNDFNDIEKILNDLLKKNTALLK